MGDSGGFDKRALYSISYGLYVVTARDGERRNGQIANTAFQVTSEPARIAVALNKKNLTHEMITRSGSFAVSVLEQETPLDFIGLFGFKSGREVDKLARVAHKPGVTGLPLVTDHALAVLEAKVTGQLDAGTHTIWVGEIVGGEVQKEGPPLTYAYYHEHTKGKTPANAPTHQVASAVSPATSRAPAPGSNPTSGTVPSTDLRSEAQGRTTEMKKYVCGVCGYVYDPAAGDPDNGVAPGTAFEDLPDGWTCPVCGAGKDEFSPEE